jgi:excinuclease ABC subunit A
MAKQRTARKTAEPSTLGEDDRIRIAGAREHNLRDISLTIPKNRLVCLTGVSGSGKSSLAFDTLYAEGQRRYIESLSSYARQFLGEMPKPDVDQITGLAPSISIQQKTSGWNPRSTVGTITQIHDYLRVLYARAGTQKCPQCGDSITAQTREQMLGTILSLPEGTRFLLLAPKVKLQKGTHKDLLAELIQQGFARARINGDVFDLSEAPELDRYKRHTIEVVVDRLVLREGIRPRVADALETALDAGNGTTIISILPEDTGDTGRVQRVAGGVARDVRLSAGFACAKCELGFEPPTPQMFSFNSPQGMCEYCDGLGTRFDFVPELLVADPKKTLLAPAITAWRTKPGKWRKHILEGVAEYLGTTLKKKWQDYTPDQREAFLYGTGDAHITFEWKTRGGVWKHGDTYAGIIAELHAKYRKSTSPIVRRFYEQFMRQQDCPRCQGARLNAQALAVTLQSRHAKDDDLELNLHQLCNRSIRDTLVFCKQMHLDGPQAVIAAEPLKEISLRLQFLVDVGLDYLTLNRSAPTLSGGESQRIRLASQIGSGLVGVMYVLDEPSIGLHPRDNQQLLKSLLKLRDQGNTVVVVEHDRDTMEVADEIVDFGPGPGVRGGKVVAQGDVSDIASSEESITGAYLSGRRQISVPTQRRPIQRQA